ncbi:hypothetical protein EUTSA_v10027316mg, partial [Eutrema salsugineum]
MSNNHNYGNNNSLLRLENYVLDESCSIISEPVKKISIVRVKVDKLHQPGIEPGSVPWQGTILPLDHWCFIDD